VTEDVNRKYPARNTTVQLSTPLHRPKATQYKRHGETDGQTTDIMPTAGHRPTACCTDSQNLEKNLQKASNIR